MVRNVLKLLLLMVIGVFASCSQSTVDETFFRFADGTPTTIVLGAEPSAQQINFETNQSDYETYSSASWLKVTQSSSNTLRLSAEANTTAVKRKAELTIYSSKFKQKIYVEQAALSTAVSIDNDAYTYGFWEATYEIPVNTIGEDWTVEVPTNEWLKVNPEPHLKRILITLSENRLYEARDLALQVKHSGGTLPLNITQQAGLKYILPFFEWGQDLESFEAKEQERRSIFVEGPAEATQVSSARPFYIYETKARLFPFVKYEMNDLKGRFLFRIILLPANSQVVRDPAFEAYLAEQGFKVVLNGNSALNNYNKVYENTAAKVNAVVNVTGDQAEIVFTPIIEQEQSYATLDSISLGFTAFKQATITEVKEYEKSIGGQYSATWSGVYQRQTKADIEIFLSGSPFYARSYVFGTDKTLGQTIFFTDKLETGMYSYAKLYFLTNEFKALLAKEGYQFYDVDPKTSTYSYVHIQKKVLLKFYYGRWNSQGVLAYNVIPININ